MKEIIQLHLGQCGVQIGSQVWELLCKEKNVGNDGSLAQINDNRVNGFFHETSKQKLVPRCLFIDTDPSSIDRIKTSEYKNVFNPRNLIKGKESTSDNFSNAYYYYCREMVDKTLEQIRKEVEKCDSFQGFILNHSIMGGTGSGFMSLLIERMSVDYGKKSKISLPIIPSKYVQNVVGYHNSVLSFPPMLEHNDLTICLDNEALYNCLDQEDELDIIQYKDINRLIAQLQSSLLTCSQSGDLKELTTNLVPYPRMHFALGSSQPLSLNSNQQNIETMVSKVFKSQNQFLTSDSEKGVCFSSGIFARGNIVLSQLVSQLQIHKISLRKVDFLPNIHKVFYSPMQSYLIQEDRLDKLKQSLVAIQNNSCISKNFSQISINFNKMYVKNAFIFWYDSLSDPGEFSEAREEIISLLKDYEELQIQTSDVDMTNTFQQ